LIQFGNMILFHLNIQFMSYFLTGRASSLKNIKVNLQKTGQRLGEGILTLKKANIPKILCWSNMMMLKRQRMIKKRKRNLISSKNCMSLMKGEDFRRCSRIYSSRKIKYLCSLILYISWSSYAKPFIKKSNFYLKLWFNL